MRGRPTKTRPVGPIACCIDYGLSMPNSRALPDDHRVLWGDVRAGCLRGGIGQQRGAVN